MKEVGKLNKGNVSGFKFEVKQWLEVNEVVRISNRVNKNKFIDWIDGNEVALVNAGLRDEIEEFEGRGNSLVSASMMKEIPCIWYYEVVLIISESIWMIWKLHFFDYSKRKSTGWRRKES